MDPIRWNRGFNRGMLLGLSALVASTGCASMKSPFGNKDLSGTPKESRFASVANAGSGITGQFKSMGTAVSSAMGKAKNAVTSTFTTSSEEAASETSLANMPSKLGPEIWVTNGQLYETQGNYAKALDNYTKALELEPNNEAALLSTSRLYARQGQNDKAADFLNKAIAVAPQAGTYNELALINQKLGKTAEAQTAVSRAIELEPTNPRYRNNLASMLVAGGRSDEAVQQLQQVFPPAIANYNVAYLHFTNSNVAAAQQHLQVALQADPNLQEARNLMDKLAGSQTAQAAVSTYNTANQIYQTAQSVMGQPSVQQIPYSQSGLVPPTQQTAPGLAAPAAGHSTPGLQPPVLPQASLVPASFAPNSASNVGTLGSASLGNSAPAFSSITAPNAQQTSMPAWNMPNANRQTSGITPTGTATPTYSTAGYSGAGS